MKRLFKKCYLFVLTLCLMASGINVVYAEDDATYTTGTYGHSPNSYDHTLTDSFIYSDSFFESSAYNADLHLAIVSLVLAETSISAKDVEYREKSQNLTEFLTNIGFQDIAVNDDYKIKPTTDTFAVAVAYKKLGDTILLAIVPRSAGYEVEWGDNFNIGSSGLHAGYESARNKCLEFAKEYISSRNDVFKDKTVKVWVSGYSRGAGVANVIGAALDDDSTNAIGLEVSKENIFTYTFGSPLTASSDLNPSEEKYKNIHNYYSDYDMSTMMPLASWGFERYGENIELDVHNEETKAKMLPLLEKMNSYVYEAYMTTEDPDDFSPMTLSTNTETGQYSIVKDTSAYTTTPKTLKAFLDDRVTILSKTVFSSREKYVENYQEVMMEIAKLLKGESSEKVALFINAAKSSTAFQPLIVMLFFYDMVQDYTSDKLDDAVPENWQEEIGNLVPAPGSSSDNPIIQQVVGTAVYKELYDKMTTTDTVDKYDVEVKTYADLMEVYRLMSAEYLNTVLEAGLTAMGYSTEHPLTKVVNEKALSEIAANLLFGSTKETEYVQSKVIYKAKIALTLLGNTFNRVHNHEILISWMRAMDTSPIVIDSTYNISGDKEWTKGSTSELQLTYDSGSITKIKIDGYDIDSSKYTIDEENRVLKISSTLLETLTTSKHMLSVIFGNVEVYHEFEVLEGAPTPSPIPTPTLTPTPSSTSEIKKSASGWDDGGPFTTDTCGNVYDRWGNIIYEANGCNVGGYNLVRTSTIDK